MAAALSDRDPDSQLRPSASLREADGADAVIASVRLNEHGQVVSAEGKAQLLAQLVAYVTRMSAIVAHHLALAPFSALEAELGHERVLVFVDGPDLVGLILPQGAGAAALRKQLGL